MGRVDDIEYTIRAGEPVPLGAEEVGRKAVNFAIMAPGEEVCSLLLYRKNTTKILTEIPLTDDMRFGDVYAVLVEGIKAGDCDYAYRIGGNVEQDPFATLINGGGEWGDKDKEYTSGIADNRYDWEGDRTLCRKFEDTIIYRMHVRGFTKNKFSGVKHKGTFKGIVEKIPYLKELGITMVELMPAYEFDEVVKKKESYINPKYRDIEENAENIKIDYWGYCEGNYFTPKVSYSSAKGRGGAVREFKDMVKALHRNGIEVAMEFYFPENVNPSLIQECFRYWVRKFHIDGIHCNIQPGIRDMIQKDPYLSKTKLMDYGWNQEKVYAMKHLAEYNDEFMNVARCFLKGDESRVADMVYRMRYNPISAATVNYIANNNTFTVYDNVVYGRKHNEINGENNKDGRELEYSWNCGYEGETRRKKVRELRIRQIKNIFTILLMSQGTPMIFAGDEFCNSRGGNNNSYCQDNEISWTSWNAKKKNEEIFQYVKFLIDFRKKHSIVHVSSQMQMRDFRALGIPDMSFHSDKTWVLDVGCFCRQFGMMLNGKYSVIYGNDEERTVYIAYNMHWEERSLGLPGNDDSVWDIEACTNTTDKPEISGRMLQMPPRTSAIITREEKGNAMAGRIKADKEKKSGENRVESI